MAGVDVELHTNTTSLTSAPGRRAKHNSGHSNAALRYAAENRQIWLIDGGMTTDPDRPHQPQQNLLLSSAQQDIVGLLVLADWFYVSVSITVSLSFHSNYRETDFVA